jgi:hypothetical protein
MWEVCGAAVRESTDGHVPELNCGKRGQPMKLPTLLPHMAQAHKSYEYHEVFGGSAGVVNNPTVPTTTTNYIDVIKVSYLPCGKR